MKNALILLSFTMFFSCSGSSAVIVVNDKTHQEIVDCVKTFFQFKRLWYPPGEKRISENFTILNYQELTKKPPPPLYTPNLIYDTTIIKIDTSSMDNVTIRVESNRSGNLFMKRFREKEAEIIQYIKKYKDELTSGCTGFGPLGGPHP